MAVTTLCIATAVTVLIGAALSTSQPYPYNYRHPLYRRCNSIRVKRDSVDDEKAKCPDGSIITSPDEWMYSARIFKYMMLICIDDRILPNKQRPYIPNDTHARLLDTFTSVSLPQLEDIPKTCPSNEQIYVANGTIVYNERTVSYCRSQQDCLEVFRTDKNIVISPFVQFLDVVAKNADKIKADLKFRQFLVDSSHRKIRNYGEHFIRTNNVIKSVSDLSYVGIHVRRTASDISIQNSYGIQFVIAEYFLKAMDYFRYDRGGIGSTVFLIVSDNLRWAGHNLLVNNDTFLVSQGGENHPEFDLALLAHCNHSIIDYGDFGLIAYMLGQQGTTVSTDADKDVVKVFGKSPNWHFIKINKDGSVVL